MRVIFYNQMGEETEKQNTGSDSPQTPQTPGVSPEEFQSFKNILWAVVIIMLLMVGFNLIEAWNNKSASLENFASQINQQNIQLQKLNDSLEKKK
jgi:hypothetical protein